MDTNDQQPTDHYEIGRTYSSVEISQKVKEQEKLTATSYLQRNMLAAMQQYERDFAAANSSPTVTTLRNLAQGYSRALTDALREDLATDVAEDISLAEAGTIRRAAKAVEIGMPGIICRARAEGMAPNEIARQLGTTGSYVRRILRENRTTLAEAVASLRVAGRKFGETVEKTRAAVEAATAEASTGEQAAAARAWARDYARKHNAEPDTGERVEELTAARAVFWTIQRREGDHWHELTAQSTTTTTPPNEFARDRLAAARKTETGSAPLRCQVWAFGESEGEPLADVIAV
ncbi:hypothetical protein [Streptomyces halstedii]|uniref:Uncharacterized protein n=1 Tax=Streptomyces halstedii TaxID=1944 RepID=A0A6N9U8E0_STRHA|nr:hypothetical protein [Streptomyces halstedii]NEA19827.1 hypothetical protein [Streptomyces halstedii]